MNTVIDREFIDFATNEIENNVKKFSKIPLEQSEVEMLAKEIISKMDWTNLFLMHKGFGILTKNYLSEISK